jgi:FkbM family methyltransferase
VNKIKQQIKKYFSFSFLELLYKYKVPKENCLHVGANIGTEIQVYEEYGFKNVVWIEGYEPYFETLKKNIAQKENHFAFNIMVSDIQDEVVNFKVASNTGSSTIFEPTNSWYETFADLSFQKTEEIKCSRIDHILCNNFPQSFLESIKFLVIDIEGAELKALKSMGSLIDKVEFALVEVSLRPNFQNAPLMIDIDKFFLQHSFRKIYLKYGPSSGDALYQRVTKLTFIDKYFTLFMDKVLQTVSILRLTDQISKIKNLIKKII